MAESDQVMLSVVVPVLNEARALPSFSKSLKKALDEISHNYEIIYVEDGSTDETYAELNKISQQNDKVRVLSLSRNFGKEIATTAGINVAGGKAIITIDGDGQHPAELIKQFVDKWKAGDKVVIGRRLDTIRQSWFKKTSSKYFYRLINRLAGIKMEPGATDFRLIDRSVQSQFINMTERNRITRGLIDWLGFDRSYIDFQAKERLGGRAVYSYRKLFKLALDSVISLSVSPLFIAAYIGAVVLPLSILIGLGMLVNVVLGDPLSLHASGGAYVLVLVLFLVGILLVSQGIIGLYLSHIHAETQNRPLYVVDESKSIRA